MTNNLRDRPLRLEAALTRDYINQAEKMREIERRLHQMQWHPSAVTLLFVLCGVLLWWVLMNY